jgi:glycogen operon protein
VDWALLERNQEIFRFTRGLIALRAAHPVLSREEFYRDGQIHWFGPDGKGPDWADPNSKKLACFIAEKGRDGLYLMFNASTEADDFALPPLPKTCGWLLSANTFLSSPKDLAQAGKEPPLKNSRIYRVEGRSSVILLARKRPSE